MLGEHWDTSCLAMRGTNIIRLRKSRPECVDALAEDRSSSNCCLIGHKRTLTTTTSSLEWERDNTIRERKSTDHQTTKSV